MFETVITFGYLLSRLPERILNRINVKSLSIYRARRWPSRLPHLFYSLDLFLPLFLWCGRSLADPIVWDKSVSMVLVLLMASGAFLRILALANLGPLFVYDVRKLEGVPPVQVGVYKRWAHPDMWGRFIEAIAMAMLFLPTYYIVFIVVIYIALMLPLMQLEGRAQQSMSNAPILQSQVS